MMSCNAAAAGLSAHDDLVTENSTWISVPTCDDYVSCCHERLSHCLARRCTEPKQVTVAELRCAVYHCDRHVQLVDYAAYLVRYDRSCLPCMHSLITHDHFFPDWAKALSKTGSTLLAVQLPPQMKYLQQMTT